MIPQRNISLLSNRLAKEGGRRLREDIIERDYCLAWFLAALAESDLKADLAFKGGTALKRCYFSDYRFSEDLDFTLVKPIAFEELIRRLESVYVRVREASGIIFTDLPENRSLSVYSLEEIASEKVLALADRARNEPRDLYDLWYLTQEAGVELTPLVDAIRQKLAFRGKPTDGIADAIQRKEGRLKALWSGRLGYQTTRLPEFDDVFRALRRVVRQANLP